MKYTRKGQTHHLYRTKSRKSIRPKAWIRTRSETLHFTREWMSGSFKESVLIKCCWLRMVMCVMWLIMWYGLLLVRSLRIVEYEDCVIDWCMSSFLLNIYLWVWTVLLLRQHFFKKSLQEFVLFVFRKCKLLLQKNVQNVQINIW